MTLPEGKGHTLRSKVIDVGCLHFLNASCFLLLKPNPDAQPNTNPIFTDSPRLVKSTANGTRYTVGNGEDAFDIIHIWGKTKNTARIQQIKGIFVKKAKVFYVMKEAI